MLRGIVIFFAICIGAMVFLGRSLQDRSFLRYIDEHQNEKWAPQVTYTTGHGYYLIQSLSEATTYFLRVAQRYPDHPLGDDGYFYYIQCLDDQAKVPRAAIIDAYQVYLEKYPKGRHAAEVKNRIVANNNIQL